MKAPKSDNRMRFGTLTPSSELRAPSSGIWKPGTVHHCIALLALFATGLYAAEPFDSGSSGSYGPMNITVSTNLDMPPDGIFHCTTINVAAGATLKFNRNALNTPVYLLATGDVVVSGTIDVSGSVADGEWPGKGGPGGFDGGRGGSTWGGFETGGYGRGPGGAKPSQAATFCGTYGNVLLSPLVGGSGGRGVDKGGAGGCGGGGAILIASSTSVGVEGVILANPGPDPSSSGRAGSGGAIRLVAPVVTGFGTLYVKGASSGTGGGRIRIDCAHIDSWRHLNPDLWGIPRGVITRGSRMVVFPPNEPRLDIIEAAGQAITEGTTSSVQIELPAGSSTHQTVKIQARNFTNDIPIRVMVYPENGVATNFDATISLGSGNPPSATVNVVVPVGMPCDIQAWTR